MGIQAGLGQQTTRVAFTLVELLLVVALLLLLFGAVVFNFGSLERGARLDEGAGQIETLFRFARAQASATGRQVRITFGDAASGGNLAGSTNVVAGIASDAGISVTWEPDPMGAPGQFEVLREAAPYIEHLATLVRIHRIPAPGLITSRNAGHGPALDGGESALVSGKPVASTESDAATSTDSTAAAAPNLPVTFYPDGSSDSVEVVLQARDDGDVRRIAVALTGLTGVIRRRSVNEGEDGGRPDENTDTVAESQATAATAAAPTDSGTANPK